jgi:hypothetical protein
MGISRSFCTVLYSFKLGLADLCLLLYQTGLYNVSLFMIACTEVEFVDEIQTKVLRVFLSHLYSFPLRFLFLQTHATSYSF